MSKDRGFTAAFDKERIHDIRDGTEVELASFRARIKGVDVLIDHGLQEPLPGEICEGIGFTDTSLEPEERLKMVKIGSFFLCMYPVLRGISCRYLGQLNLFLPSAYLLKDEFPF